MLCANLTREVVLLQVLQLFQTLQLDPKNKQMTHHLLPAVGRDTTTVFFVSLKIRPIAFFAYRHADLSLCPCPRRLCDLEN